MAIPFVYAQINLEVLDLGQFSQLETECITEHNLNASKITDFLKKPYMPEDDVEANKFMECTWKKEGYLNKRGELKWKAVKKYVKNVYVDAVGMPELADFFANDTISHCRGVEGISPGQLSSINFNSHEKECTKELYGDGIEIKYFNRRYLPENNDIVSNIVKCSWKKDGLINEFDEIVYDNLKIFIINEYRTAGECSYYLALLVSGDAYNNCKDMLGESSGEDLVLSQDEEECIKETKINRDIVMGDKISTKNHDVQRDDDSKNLLNDYLGCYSNKLSAKGKLSYTKSVFVRIPGYNTFYEIKSLWCDDDYYSNSNKGRPCAQRI
ncbi:hypothetical protein FQR65_LT07883 [Abscondita terminalis]|nr:hypothetical protein FQR65_LT07883 [Abscondita terminalis]